MRREIIFYVCYHHFFHSKLLLTHQVVNHRSIDELNLHSQFFLWLLWLNQINYRLTMKLRFKWHSNQTPCYRELWYREHWFMWLKIDTVIFTVSKTLSECHFTTLWTSAYMSRKYSYSIYKIGVYILAIRSTE